jgi:hypothetical protein
MKLLAFLAAVACIVIGFGVAVLGTWLMPSLAWFLAAIAIAVVFKGGPET